MRWLSFTTSTRRRCRLYEREGLLAPSRSIGNTRLYEDSDLERLEIILSLTRELGVNLAGVEIILNMRAKMDQMQREFEQFFEYLKTHANEFSRQSEAFSSSEALIPISRFRVKPRPSEFAHRRIRLISSLIRPVDK